MFIARLNGNVLSVVLPSVIMLNVTILYVVAPSHLACDRALIKSADISSTVVGHSPHDPKVKGSSTAITAGGGREKK